MGSRSLIVKIRAKGLDRATFQRTLDLCANGFGPDAADGISIPQAVGVVPSHHMWLQQKVDGIPGEVALLSPYGPNFCSRVAEFIHKLQNTKIECARTYTIRDELDSLHQWIPTLAAGNFIAHITELSLRLRGHADALAECERALTSRLAELATGDLQPALEAYTTLSLVRHIALSTRYPDRSHTTEDLLDLCEKRIGLRPHEIEQSE